MAILDGAVQYEDVVKVFFPTLHYSTTPSLRAKQNAGRTIFFDPAPKTGFLDLNKGGM